MRDKEDLLDGVAEAALRRVPDRAVVGGPGRAGPSRRARVAHTAEGAPERDGVARRAQAPAVLPGGPSPTKIALPLLRRPGLSERETVWFQAIGGYIFGFVMMEIGNVAPGRPGGPDVTTALGDLQAEFPCFAALFPWLAACNMDTTFDFGLDLLLEGSARRPRRPSREAATRDRYGRRRPALP
jgi:tetracycline repressor-like protein